MHLFDLAVTNSWIQYRTDHKASGKPEKESLQYLDIKLLLAEQMIAQAQDGRGQQVASDEEMSSDDEEFAPHCAPHDAGEKDAKAKRLSSALNATCCCVSKTKK